MKLLLSLLLFAVAAFGQTGAARNGYYGYTLGWQTNVVWTNWTSTTNVVAMTTAAPGTNTGASLAFLNYSPRFSNSLLEVTARVQFFATPATNNHTFCLAVNDTNATDAVWFYDVATGAANLFTVTQLTTNISVPIRVFCGRATTIPLSTIYNNGNGSGHQLSISQKSLITIREWR